MLRNHRDVTREDNAAPIPYAFYSACTGPKLIPTSQMHNFRTLAGEIRGCPESCNRLQNAVEDGKIRTGGEGLLEVGTAVSEINPIPGVFLSGFSARTEPHAGVHDPLQACALAARDASGTTAAIVVLDLLGVDTAMTAAIREAAAAQTGMPPEHIAVAATHTHGAPAVLTEAQLGPVSLAYREAVIAAAAASVTAACAQLAPAALSFAIGEEHTVAHNRRVPGGVIDPAVPVLAVTRPDGAVAGLVTGYACHPVVLGPNNLLATADYPGFVRRALQGATGARDVLFLTGCCGQINTGHSAADSIAGRGLERRTFAAAAQIGDRLAAAAGQALAQARPVHAWTATDHAVIRVARRTVSLPFAPLAPGSEPPDPVTTEVLALSLAGAVLVFLPGEVFVETGLALRAAYSGTPMLIAAYAHHNPGYIPAPTAFAAGGYEVDEAYRYYGQPAPFAAEASVNVLTAALQAVNSVVRGELRVQ